MCRVNKYELVIIASYRFRELNRGGYSCISNIQITNIEKSLREIYQGFIDIKKIRNAYINTLQ